MYVPYISRGLCVHVRVGILGSGKEYVSGSGLTAGCNRDTPDSPLTRPTGGEQYRCIRVSERKRGMEADRKRWKKRGKRCKIDACSMFYTFTKLHFRTGVQCIVGLKNMWLGCFLSVNTNTLHNISLEWGLKIYTQMGNLLRIWCNFRKFKIKLKLRSHTIWKCWFHDPCTVYIMYTNC